MIQQTSLDAFTEVRKNLGFKQKVILDAIKALGECDNTLIADYLYVPINTVTPRVLELRKMGYVVNSGIKANSQGRLVHFWRAKHE